MKDVTLLLELDPEDTKRQPLHPRSRSPRASEGHICLQRELCGLRNGSLAHAEPNNKQQVTTRRDANRRNSAPCVCAGFELPGFVEGGHSLVLFKRVVFQAGQICF